MRILITGAGGFIGAHVAETATARGHTVTRSDLSPASGVTPLDVRDAAAVTAAVAGHDGVIHCASVVGPGPARRDPVLTVHVNVLGTTHVLAAARAAGVPVVALSTATLYGRRPDLRPLSEDEPVDPVGPYDASKAAAEIVCATYRAHLDTTVVSIRTSFVYGHGHSTGEYFLSAALAGHPVREPAGADHPCDFTYVVDLADALVTALERSPLPELVYNISGGVLRTRGELAACVRNLVPGADIELGPGVDPARHLRGPCDLRRAQRDLGYEPRFTLEQGLAEWLQRARA